MACLTPPVAGAIATLAVRGSDAWPVTRALFRGKLPDQPMPHRFYLGRVGEGAEPGDEVVLAVKPEWLEIHCHGGVEVMRFLQELFAARGVNVGSWEEVTGAGDSRLRRLARQELVQAPTVKTAAILLDQFGGAFESSLTEVLTDLASLNHAKVVSVLFRLAQTQHLGRHLVQPFRVALAG